MEVRAMSVCACEHINRATWDSMTNVFKYNAYCVSCGFDCEAKTKVLELRWCEIHDIVVSQLD